MIVRAVALDPAGGETRQIPTSWSECSVDAFPFIDEGPTDVQSTGAVRVVTGSPFPSDITWYTDATQTKKIMSTTYVRNSSQAATTVTQILYDLDGTTVIRTCVDTYTYTNGVIETSRSRAIRNTA